MPLTLVPPRKGKTPFFYMRGSHVGVRVNESCRTDKRSVARKVLVRREQAIERGEWPPKSVPRADGKTFLTAAVRYMETGHRPKYIAPLIKRLGHLDCAVIGQDEADDAAVALYPNVTPATRNSCVYTPLIAVLRNAGYKPQIRRPQGAKGRVVTDSLSKEDALAILKAADGFDPEYGLLLRFLLYTGVRLGEALSLTWDLVRLDEKRAWIRTSKNGDPRELVLRDDLVAAMLVHTRRNNDLRVFRFHQGGHLKHQLLRAKLAALGLDCPIRRPKDWRPPPYRLSWVNHHSFRHTWATWMRRYGGADVKGLVATGNWRDARSASRYAHAQASEEWARVERLPSVGGDHVDKERNRA